MIDEKQTPPPAEDDWLSETGEGKDSGFGQIDQVDIDQLLGEAGINGNGQRPAADLPAAGPHPLPADAQEGTFELDQAALDALLSHAQEKPAADAAGPGFASSKSPAVDRSSLAALLNTDDEDFQAALADDSNVPSQADIDELFAQAQEGDEGTAASRDDDIDMDELFGGAADQPSPHSPDFSQPAAAGIPRPESAAARQDGFMAAEEATLSDDIFDEGTALSSPGNQPRPWRKFLPPQLAASASRPVVGGVLVAGILLVGGIYFLTLRSPAPLLPALDDQPQRVATPSAAPVLDNRPQPALSPTEELAAVKPVNTPPATTDAEYEMPAAGGEIPLLLFAQDADGDALTYEITVPPAHGRLAGDLPTPVYLPAKDFPGSDRLEYRVTDGRQYSAPATILISGPNLQTAAGESGSPAVIAPKPPQLQARDLTLKTLSTQELMIDWRQIWQQTTGQAFPADMSVEVFADGLQGRLTQIDSWRHRYQPDRLFSGSEVIGYRVRQGSVSSKRAELRLLVDAGDYPPEIRVQTAPVEGGEYLVGETVVLDASGTRDDKPENLRFAWRQTAGPPVQLKQLNPEGSIVSLVVPSYFYTVADPGPVLLLTVTDDSGQREEKTININSRSRRHSALLGRSRP